MRITRLVAIFPLTMLLTAAQPAIADPASEPNRSDAGHDMADHASHKGHTAQPSADRIAEVAARSAEVMPFGLDRSMHVFAVTDSGGVQTVYSKDSDPREVALIRNHLEEVAREFARGDFGRPLAVHGPTMPGLEALRRSGNKLDISFEEVPNGARIRYTGHDPDTINAIHSWFSAQLSDHGKHATAH